MIQTPLKKNVPRVGGGGWVDDNAIIQFQNPGHFENERLGKLPQVIAG
jgi:hypothetical protein